MIYSYKAIDKNGKEITDYIDAGSETAARSKLKHSGLYIISINTESATQTRKSSLKNSFNDILTIFSRNASKKQVPLFSRQLGTLLNAGMPLVTVLNDIIEQVDSRTFKSVLIDVRDKIEEGSSFSNALNNHRDIFSDMYISMIKVGENLGSLSEVVTRLAEMEEKKAVMINKIRAAMWYPTFILLFSIIIVTFLMVKIIPTISEVFLQQDRTMPTATNIVIAISNFLQDYWIFIPVVFIVLLYIIKRYNNTDKGRIKIDSFKLKFPLIKGLYNKLIVYRFTQNMGVLLSNNVDLLKSFEIVKKIVNNRVIEHKIEDAAKRVKEGSSITLSLKKNDFLPKLVIGMISAGEASDKVDDMMLNIGKVYEEEIEMTIGGLTAMVEPVIIVFMGIIIGVIVLSVMMPIMEMNLMVQ